MLSRGLRSVSAISMPSSQRIVQVQLRRTVHTENPLSAHACKAWSCVQKATNHELFGYTNKAMAILVPTAVVLSPSILNAPVDLTLGLVVPAHMYMGCVHVIEDYVPQHQQSLSVTLLGLLTLLTALGMLKINLCGVGVTECVKSLWRAPKKKSE